MGQLFLKSIFLFICVIMSFSSSAGSDHEEESGAARVRVYDWDAGDIDHDTSSEGSDSDASIPPTGESAQSYRSSVASSPLYPAAQPVPATQPITGDADRAASVQSSALLGASVDGDETQELSGDENVVRVPLQTFERILLALETLESRLKRAEANHAISSWLTRQMLERDRRLNEFNARLVQLLMALSPDIRQAFAQSPQAMSFERRRTASHATEPRSGKRHHSSGLSHDYR